MNIDNFGRWDYGEYQGQAAGQAQAPLSAYAFEPPDAESPSCSPVAARTFLLETSLKYRVTFKRCHLHSNKGNIFFKKLGHAYRLQWLTKLREDKNVQELQRVL